MIEQIGAFAGLAAFLGLAILALLSFAHGRDIRRLREWAGSAPERDAGRKQATSAMAAQRAEELRALERGRTVEQAAVGRREARRRRRDAGLPELTRRERLREWTAELGERLARPRNVAVLLVVLALVAAGVVYAALSGGESGGGHRHGREAAARIAPDEIEVSVLNGTAVPELAGTFGRKLRREGFKIGNVSNTNSSFAKSVVMFDRGHAPEARKVAKRLEISKLRPMSSEVESVSAGAKVAVVVGEDNAAAAN